MGYSISILTDEKRIPEIIELFRAGLGETTQAHWKWRLFAENGQPDQPLAVIVEDETGKLAAVSSMLPAVYGFGDTERKCLQFCDWVVHPDHRGKGLIGQIYRFVCDYYIEKEYDFVMEFPNNNSYPIFMKYGFREESHISSWNTRKKLFVFERTPRNCYLKGTEIRFTKHCPFENETFYRGDRIQRSADYFQWKYDKNPDMDYHWVSFWNEDICVGYAVYTLTQGRLRKAVNIYDWDCREQASFAFSEAVRQLKKIGNWVSIWGRYSGMDQEILKKAGLFEGDRTTGTRLVLKSLSSKGWPDPLTLTRIDTDY